MEYGLLTLLPIAVVIVLALLTKRTLEPLIAGTVVAYIIIAGWKIPAAWMGAFLMWHPIATTNGYLWSVPCSAA